MQLITRGLYYNTRVILKVLIMQSWSRFASSTKTSESEFDMKQVFVLQVQWKMNQFQMDKANYIGCFAFQDSVQCHTYRWAVFPVRQKSCIQGKGNNLNSPDELQSDDCDVVEYVTRQTVAIWFLLTAPHLIYTYEESWNFH